MSRSVRLTVFSVRKSLVILALGLRFLLSAGCQQSAEVEGPPPSLWWYTQTDSATGEMPFRSAMLMAWEGWNGAESKATSLTFFSDLYENGGLLMKIGMFGKGSRPRCSMQGCYVYVRHTTGAWKTLRAVPANEARDILEIVDPWSLQWMIEGGTDLEIEVPIQPRGSCVYTLPVSGYRWALHQPSGVAKLHGDGTPRDPIELTEDDRRELAGPPPEDSAWPICTDGEP